MNVRHLPQPPAPRQDTPLGWGAAIIDEQGNEVPITEAMVQRACEELARTWIFPRLQAANAR